MNKTLSGLYVISNENLMPEDKFLSMSEAALSSGARILQYRDKSSNRKKRLYQASELKKLCDKHNAVFIINDDIELAIKVDADGVHIGKDDNSIERARKQLGENKIIGVSCYNSIELAKNAINNGADYIAFGSFFGSSIKPDAPRATIDQIQAIKKTHDIPVCCIGGITRENYTPLVTAGADMLAVISDIFSSPSTHKIAEKCKGFSIQP
jgi:thiamine-phosphate pyrophosphorylase